MFVVTVVESGLSNGRGKVELGQAQGVGISCKKAYTNYKRFREVTRRFHCRY